MENLVDNDLNKFRINGIVKDVSELTEQEYNQIMDHLTLSYIDGAWDVPIELDREDE